MYDYGIRCFFHYEETKGHEGKNQIKRGQDKHIKIIFVLLCFFAVKILFKGATPMEFDELSNRVIGYAIEVHKQLGPGLLGKKVVAGFGGRMYDYV